MRGNLKTIDVETKKAQVAHDTPLHNISKDCLDGKTKLNYLDYWLVDFLGMA